MWAMECCHALAMGVQHKNYNSNYNVAFFFCLSLQFIVDGLFATSQASA